MTNFVTEKVVESAGKSSADRLGRRVGAPLVLLALAGITGLLLVEPVSSLPMRLLRDYTEGWNAYWAAAAANGSTLYPDPLALISNNYPPLSFYVVGWLGSLLGDEILAGRLIALAGLLSVTVNVFLVLRALGVSTLSAGFGALLFIGFTTSVYFSAIATDAPAWLAQALMTTGLVVFLTRERWSEGYHVLSALLALAAIAAGLLAKHNLLALPVSLFLWCFIYDRIAFWSWLAAAPLLCLGVASAAYAVYGTNFFCDILLHERTYSVWALADRIRIEATPYLPMGMGALVLLMFNASNPDVRLVSLYVLTAAMLGIFFLGGVGVGANVLNDLTVALSLAAGLLLDRLQARAAPLSLNSGRAGACTMLLLALPIATHLPVDLLLTRYGLTDGPRRAASLDADVAFLAAVPGPAACQMLALCYWAGKDFDLDFFNTNQKIAKGRLSGQGIADRIAARYYGVIEIDANPPAQQRLPDTALVQLNASYRIAHTDGSMLFYVIK